MNTESQKEAARRKDKVQLVADCVNEALREGGVRQDRQATDLSKLKLSDTIRAYIPRKPLDQDG